MENKKGIKIYYGISAGNWKQRLYSRRDSFSNPSLRNQTALSNGSGDWRIVALYHYLDGILLKDQPPQVISEVNVISIYKKKLVL